MYEIFENPLWWIIPGIILASFLVNHRVELPHKKDDSGSSQSQTEKKDDNNTTQNQQQNENK